MCSVALGRFKNYLLTRLGKISNLYKTWTVSTGRNRFAYSGLHCSTTRTQAPNTESVFDHSIGELVDEVAGVLLQPWNWQYTLEQSLPLPTHKLKFIQGDAIHVPSPERA